MPKHAVPALALAILGLADAGACTDPKVGNCADPAAACTAHALPAGARLINDFESAPAPVHVPVGCTQLYVNEPCTFPLKNKLGLCADSLFCACGGSVCGSPVQGTAAFRGGRSWRLRFNESLIPDASVASPTASDADGGVCDSTTGYPFSGYTERLSSVLEQGPGCDGVQPPFNAESFYQLTFWVKAEEGVDFEIALKSYLPTSPPSYVETYPKLPFTDCQSWSSSCICAAIGDWQKVCIPLTKLEPAALGARVDLSKLVEINLAFAADPYVINRHERGAAEITIDEIAFEPQTLSTGN
jgi:hypothetical protein